MKALRVSPSFPPLMALAEVTAELLNFKVPVRRRDGTDRTRSAPLQTPSLPALRLTAWGLLAAALLLLPSRCMVSTCLLPALGLTALGGLQGFQPSRILGLHTSASWKSGALVYTSGGEGTGADGGRARLGRAEGKSPFPFPDCPPSPQPLAGGLPALKAPFSGVAAPSPCPSSEAPRGWALPGLWSGGDLWGLSV